MNKLFSFLFVLTFLCLTVSAAVDTSVDYFNLNSSEDSLQTVAPGVLNNDLSIADIVDVYLVSNETLHGAVYFFNGLISGGLGSFTYETTFTNFSGVDYFDYIANDGVANSTSTRVWLGINNSVPLISDDLFVLTNDSEGSLKIGSPGLLNNDLKDSNNDTLYLYIVNESRKGTIFELNWDGMGSFSYETNSTTFHGVDYFHYILSDGYSNSTSARVVLSFNNSKPIAVEDRYTITDSINTTNATGVLANDSDVDNDELELSITENVKFGELKTSNTGFSVNGSFNYTSNKTNGVDYFVYELTDYHLIDSAKCIFIIGNNTAPTANNDSYYTSLDTLNVSESLGVLANDNDSEDDVLFVKLVNTTNNGTLDLNSDGSFTYTPNVSFVGTDSFTYYITDLDKTSENVTVTIYVNTSVVSNITDSSDNTTTAGSNVTVNVSSDVYPLILNFQLYNGNVLVNESNFTANSSLDLPTNYSVPTGLAAGNYTLNLSLYSSTNELLNKTTLAEFEIQSTGSGDNNDGNTGGGGGGSSRRTVTNQTNVTVNATIPTTSNTTVTNQTNSTVSEVEEEQPGRFSTITGNVIGTTAGRVSLGIILFLILVGLAYWIVAKKRKAAKAPVKMVKMSSMKKKKKK